MSAVTVSAEGYSPRRQWLSRLAVAFMMVAGFIGGNAFALGGLPDPAKAGPFWLAWAGFQLVCLLLGKAWARSWKGNDAFIAGFCWKLKKFRVRMRRRLFPNRNWEDYRRAEQSIIVLCVPVSFVAFILISLSLKVGLLVGFAVVFALLLVVPYYRDAAETPINNVIFAGLVSLAWGYLFATSL